MEAQEIGIKIRIDAIVDLTGSTIRNLLVCGPKDVAPRLLPVTIDIPPNFGFHITVATDFPDAGNYFIQLRAIFADGRDLRSPPLLLRVNAAF